ARLDQQIDDLFRYQQLSREEAPGARISLVLVVNEVIGQLRRDPDFAAAEINVYEPLPWVLAHRATLGLVMQNLIAHSLRSVAKDTKPRTTIRAERAESSEMTKIVIEDNGVRDDASKEKEDIDLAIVKRGIERMGGKFGSESSPSGGNRFWIELK